jgi:hypothetical protein
MHPTLVREAFHRGGWIFEGEVGPWETTMKATGLGLAVLMLMGCASAFGEPNYAAHRNEVARSLDGVQQFILDALPHVTTPEDLALLSTAVNGLSDRWKFSSDEGFTGGYDVGGDLGALFNPRYRQLSKLAVEQPDQSPDVFAQWLHDYVLNKGRAANWSVAGGNPNWGGLLSLLGISRDVIPTPQPTELGWGGPNYGNSP